MDMLINLPIINKTILVSAPKCEKLRSGHSHFNRKLNKLNINDFFRPIRELSF